MEFKEKTLEKLKKEYDEAVSESNKLKKEWLEE